MFFINSFVILFMSCLITLMSLKNSDAAAVGVQKSASFKYKEVRNSRPQTKAKLFMPQAKVKSSVDQQTTKLFLNLRAKAARNKDNDNDNDKNDENKELTLSLPKFTRNAQGNWVALKWGNTPGGVWQDTRFFQGDKYRPLGSMTEDKLIKKDYYPVTAKLSTVCFGKSKIYNIPAQKNYLTRGIHAHPIQERVFWNVLRREIYNFGRYNECHDPVKYTRWLDYHECALRRNQRIEYLIPKYPLYQRGYYANYKIYRHFAQK
ncbi:uncharacterized protein LOC117780379 [Drosophila innubila]|uniref:uncharacterized protein LOC117780379 n=1 Tax=Drosophila innubila TaxID=198719 RepID=UPI00148BCE28|nr:uncharacterized protein LOC117780379 [Drosophila innubila]